MNPCESVDGHALENVVDRNEDDIPALATGVEPVEPNVDSISPHKLAQEIVARGDHETLPSAIENNDLDKALKARGVKPLHGAREAELKHGS